MGDSFTGIRLKRRRAWDEVNRLNDDIQTFISAEPTPYLPRVHFDKKTHIIAITVAVQKAPDPMWGVRIGEIIHNLRSALDHLVWELFILHNRKPPPLPSKNQFPIFDTKARFKAHGVPVQLKGVSDRAIRLIEAEQPFPVADGGTGEGVNSPLWHLAELSNADKHRTLHVTGNLLQSFEFTFAPLIRDATIEREMVHAAGPIQQDTILGRARVVDGKGWPFAEREVNGQLTVDIAFDERTPAVGGWIVIATLIDIANRTDRILSTIGRQIFGIDL